MARLHRERILILAKTYPSPSAKHVETSCVAGINAQGVLRRLYPVPFRMIEQNQQFKKWQWIDAAIEHASADHRPESHKIDIGTLKLEEVLSTQQAWQARRQWLDKIPTFTSFAEMERTR
ncbi:MAG: hypothetical protein LBL69_03130, partial [Zoogloeaceae bacterium]|nr:hypothetical protein [Zoogloeaceae bacterium]